jgi:hypothetical protein
MAAMEMVADAKITMVKQRVASALTMMLQKMEMLQTMMTMMMNKKRSAVAALLLMMTNR